MGGKKDAKKNGEVPPPPDPPPDGPPGTRRSVRTVQPAAAAGAASTSSQQNPLLAQLASLKDSISAMSERLQNPTDSDGDEEDDFISDMDLKTMFKFVVQQLSVSRETNLKLTETVQRLSTELAELKGDVDTLKQAAPAPAAAVTQSLNELKNDVTNLSAAITPLTGAVAKHQEMHEEIEFQRRELNVIVTGLTESNDANHDSSSVTTLLAQLECGDISVVRSKRLGKIDNEKPIEERRRPLVVQLQSAQDKWRMLKASPKLKEGEHFQRVFLKKDEPLHIRKEWSRLRSIVKSEKERPQNQGCTIRLDYKRKVVLKDDIVIAHWDLGARGPTVEPSHD